MDLQQLEKYLEKDIKVVLRNYSGFRAMSSKWIYMKRPIKAINQENYTLEESSFQKLAVLHRKNAKCLEIFSYTTLLKRVAMKRKIQLFEAIYEFWQLVNPYRLAGISKEVYSAIFEFIYYDFVGGVTRDYAKQSVFMDASADFGKKEHLNFSDFYDALFEWVDCYSGSSLMSEYVRAVKTVHGLFENKRCFKSLKLFSKLHLDENSKPHYEPWMLEHISQLNSGHKNFSLKKAPPLILKNQSSKRIANSLPSSKTKKSLRDEGSDIKKKIQKILNYRPVTSTNFYKSASQVFSKELSEEPKPKAPRTNMYIANHLEKISPISVYKSPKLKKSKVLEEVIETRRGYYSQFSKPVNLYQTY